MTVPNHRERQWMQHLRGAGSVKAIPQADCNLLGKGWIERNESDGAMSYRLTDQDLRRRRPQ
jgi:hypothetical protein